MKGLLIISVPKSGTMFLSNYLGAVTGYQSVFGLPCESPQAMLSQIPGEPSELIGRHLAPDSPTPERMVKKYIMMINRNRTRKRTRQPEVSEKTIITDHGFDNFLVFLRNPDKAGIISPKDIVAMAKKMDMGVLYLYREIDDIVNSFAHFIASKRSYLITIDSLEAAREIAVKEYAGVLARHIERWKHEFDQGLILKYEQLNEDTRGSIQMICDRYGLPYEKDKLISNMKDFRAWTFRKGTTNDSKKDLSLDHREYLQHRFGLK
ncbi:MAG: sulfotransferase domain-containing protein [Pseudomonadota bacterium]